MSETAPQLQDPQDPETLTPDAPENQTITLDQPLTLLPGKKGRLEGGALTDEALASSRMVLTGHRGQQDNLIGLQQWFSPEPAANLIAASFGTGYNAPRAVLDPTAGAGSLLAPFHRQQRFGIEIDGDYAGAPDEDGRTFYTAIQGDAQKAVPMLRAAGVRFPAVALNPPFGLYWKDGAHSANPKAQIGSTLLAYLWTLDLTTVHGQGAMICGRDRLAKEILGREEAKGIYAIVDVEGPLFDGVSLPCSIAFFVQPDNRKDLDYIEAGEESGIHERFSAYREDLEGLASEVRRAKNLAAKIVMPGKDDDPEEITTSFRTISSEYARRKKAEQGKSKKPGQIHYDVDLNANRINVRLRAYNKLVLAQKGRLREVELLANQSTAYFGQNRRAYRQLMEAEDEGLITLSPALKSKVEAEAEEAERQATPLFPVPPQMRLGWLTDLDRITCKKGDPDYGFVAGESYHLSTRSEVREETESRAVETRSGEPDIRQFRTQRKLLQIHVGQHLFDEGNANIEYLSEHFELPDPGDVATRHPEETARNRRLLDEMELEIRENYDAYKRAHGETDFEQFSYKEFQKDHMSRLLVKGRGMLAHEQGLGKSLMQMSLAEAQVRLGAKNQVLYVVPQDLIPQTSRESKKFFGIDLEEIRSPEQARRVSRRIAAGEEGRWITYYEALSLVGRKKETLPVRPLHHKVALAHRLKDYKSKGLLKEGRDVGLVDISAIEKTLGVPMLGATTKDACPECHADTSQGWDSESCKRCHYVHRSIYKKTAVSHLTTSFKRGVICVDEVSEIRGDDSLRSKAVRALVRGPWKFGATGTPLSNFLSDSFYPLGFSLGPNSTAFPYSFDAEGKSKFEADFCVIENMMGREEDGESNVKKRRKLLPQITNVSQFWRLAQPGVSRCRKEQTGEPLVERMFHPVRVPMGAAQKKMHEYWLNNFTNYFGWKFPNHELVKEGLVDKFAAALGQLWRLESASTLPAADEPTSEYPDAAITLRERSNFTPANLKVLELAKEHADNGEKVLIGSDLIMTGRWLAEQLNAKGIKTGHITEDKPDGIATKNPRKRAAAINDFADGDTQVLCVGVGAMKLGHDLAVASTVITTGLPWSHMVLSQFVARVHRLTSKKPVSVYVVMPKGSLSERKWTLLKNKGATSDLAYDGELKVQPEKATDWQKILKEMKQRGIRSEGTSGTSGESGESSEVVDERDVAAAWRKVPVSLPSLSQDRGSAAAASPGTFKNPAPAQETKNSHGRQHRTGESSQKSLFSDLPEVEHIEAPERYTQQALF